MWTQECIAAGVHGNARKMQGGRARTQGNTIGGNRTRSTTISKTHRSNKKTRHHSQEKLSRPLQSAPVLSGSHKPLPAAASRRATVTTIPHCLVSKRQRLFRRPLTNRKTSRAVFRELNRHSTLRGILQDRTLDPIHGTTLKTEGVTSLVHDKVGAFAIYCWRPPLNSFCLK
jgi:hypothetical protein